MHLSFCYCASPNFLCTAIDQLFHHCKSSKYSITVHRKNVWQHQIAYLEIFRRFLWLLFKYLFLGYCVCIILLLRISHLFMYCKSANYFTPGNHLNIWLMCTEIFYDNFKSHVWKHFNNLYGYSAKAQFLVYCAYNIYFPNANLPIIYLLQID